MSTPVEIPIPKPIQIQTVKAMADEDSLIPKPDQLSLNSGIVYWKFKINGGEVHALTAPDVDGFFAFSVPTFTDLVLIAGQNPETETVKETTTHE